MINFLAVLRGTELHEYAATAIRLKRKQPKTKETLNMYVNDAIGFDMSPEVTLFYSENAFGTADSIIFDEKKRLLRVHDYKSGTTPVHMEQLYIYAALFCLEYEFKPGDLNFELRIYQNGEQMIDKPEVNIILPIMDEIVRKDKLIEQFKEGA